MKKLGLLLSALLVVSTVASSPVLASRPSFQYRIQSLLAVFYQSTFPFSFSGVFIMPGEIEPVDNDGNEDIWVGGDADDYGNGRGAGDVIGIGGKETFRPVGSAPQGLERHSAGVSKKRT